MKQREFTILGNVFDVVAIVVRAVARSFCNGGAGGHYRECRRQEPFTGAWGYPPPDNFQVWRLRNAISALVMRYVSEKMANSCKSRLIIKITESNENKSTQRLDVSGLTGPGERGPLPPCPPPPASYGSGPCLSSLITPDKESKNEKHDQSL